MNEPFNNDADQDERRDLLDNHLRLKEQGSTYLSHSHFDLEIGGRFKKSDLAKETIIGRDPVVRYPGNVAEWVTDTGPPEPCLGFSVDALEPTGEIFEQEASLGTPLLEAAIAPSQEGEATATRPPSNNSSSAEPVSPSADRAAAPAGTAVERRPTIPFRRRV